MTLTDPSISDPNAFDSAGWSKAFVTVTANDAVDPDGTSLADRITETGDGSSQHRYVERNAVGIVTGQSVTLQVRAKRNDLDFLYILTNGGATIVWFNLLTGTVGTETGATGAITDLGDGWYLCSLTYTANSAAFRIGVSRSNGTLGYSEATGGRYLWLYGAQVVQTVRVSQWDDKSGRGNHFGQSTITERPILAQWAPTGKGAVRLVNNTSWLKRSSNADLAFTDESWLVAMTIELDPTFTAFEVWLGNGHSSTADQGYRCFISSTGAMAVYASNDGTGAMSQFSSFSLTAGARYVVVWGVDGPSGGGCVFATSAHAVERRTNLRGYPIPNGGLDVTIGGAHGSVGYRPGGYVHQIAAWKRPSTSSFSDGEIAQVIEALAQEAEL